MSLKANRSTKKKKNQKREDLRDAEKIIRLIIKDGSISKLKYSNVYYESMIKV